MHINHRPALEIDKVEEIFLLREGTPVKYVCSSALTESGVTDWDIFYRDTPHPEFGNRYLGLGYENNQLCICNADNIENLTFDMIEVNGELHYSKSRWDFHSVGDVSIDGGRSYLRLVGNCGYPQKQLVVKDGKFNET